MHDYRLHSNYSDGRFRRERLVDELRLSLVPVLLGDGSPLFAGGYERRGLRFVDVTVHDDTIVEHRYEFTGASPDA